MRRYKMILEKKIPLKVQSCIPGFKLQQVDAL